MEVSVRAPHLPALVSTLAFCAATTVALLFALYVITGIGQDALQVVRAPVDYAAELLRNPVALKMVLGLDNLFILFYLPMFLAIGAIVSAQPVSRTLLTASIALITATQKGKPIMVMAARPKKAPSIISSPCAKLTVSVSL